MKLIDTRNQAAKSRAEAAREKRTATSREKFSRVNHNVVVPSHRTARTAPPVTVRGGYSGTPLHQKSRSKPRRQFYYALGATGAEVRLPAVPSINLGGRLISGLVVALLVAALFLAYNTPELQVQDAQITGLKRLKPADVNEVLGLKNMPVFLVDPSAVQAQIETEFPQLASVDVKIKLPAKVVITATERQPVLVWKYKDTTYWVDKEGFIFKPAGQASGLVQVKSDERPPLGFNDVPLTGSLEEDISPDAAAPTTPADKVAEKNTVDAIKGLVGQSMDLTVLQAALSLKKSIPSGTSLVYTSKDGMGWTDPGGWNVYVGLDLQNIGLKLKVYRAVVEKLSQDSVTPAMISVENLDAPFYRLEQ